MTKIRLSGYNFGTAYYEFITKYVGDVYYLGEYHYSNSNESFKQNDMEELIREINQYHPLCRNLNMKIIINFEE